MGIQVCAVCAGWNLNSLCAASVGRAFESSSAAAVQWEAAPLVLEMKSADRRAESRHVCTPLSLSLVTHCDNTKM